MLRVLHAHVKKSGWLRQPSSDELLALLKGTQKPRGRRPKSKGGITLMQPTNPGDKYHGGWTGLSVLVSPPHTHIERQLNLVGAPDPNKDKLHDQ